MEYARRRWLLGFLRDRSLQALLGYLVVTLGLGALAWDIVNAAPRGLGAVLGLTAVGLSLIAAILRLATDTEKREVEARLPKLRWIFEADSPTSVHQLPPAHALGRGGQLYRVGVQNDGSTAAENVRVRLVEALPGAPGLPATLRRMHDSPYAPAPFTVNAHSREYVDVVIVPEALAPKVIGDLNLSVDDPAPHMFVCFADTVFPWMPIQDYALRITAEGSNIGRPLSAAFRIARDEARITVTFETD